MKSKKEGADFKKIFSYLIKLIAVFVIYFIAGKIGLSLAFFHPSASPVWFGTGISIAALLILGYKFWPAIFFGAFFVNLTTEGTILTSLGIATGNMLEGLFGAYFITRFAQGEKILDNPKNIFTFLIIAVMVSIVSATIGVFSLSFGGFAAWATYVPVWLTWWVGDVIGALVIFPLIISWYKPIKINADKIAEGILIMSAVLVTAVLIFTQWSPFATENYPVPFLSILPIMLACFRLGSRGTTLAILIMSAVAVFGTVTGFGPFALYSPNESLVFLQSYMGVISLTGLVIASLVAKDDKIKNKRQR